MSAPRVTWGWTRGRFWSVVSILFVLQTGLILLLAEREPNHLTRRLPATHFRVEEMPMTDEQMSQRFFAMDPTVFLLPGRHGFSGEAWMQPPTNQFQPPNETENPAWLSLNLSRLGTHFPSVAQASHFVPAGTPDQHSPELEPWPASLSPDLLRTQSRFSLQGDLAGRLLNAPVSLPTWTNSQLLANNVVEIAANSAGQVIAARLLSPRSGLGSADSNAIVQARNLRFRPMPGAPVWGTAVFEWQTAEPANPATAISP